MSTVKMEFRESDSSCDLYISPDGYAEVVNGNEEIAQGLKDELESNMTQWYLGYNWGTKLLQDDGSGIFDKKGITDAEITQEIQRVISKRKDILKSTVESITKEDRKMFLEITIETKYGKDNLSISFMGGA
ncbi:MAG: hypothetical protein ACRCXT_07565 [Paraclostridium sp.]